MSNPILRDYDTEDLLMLERAQVFHNAFVIDKATFTADFPHLDDPFAANMQTAIDAADAIPSGAEVDAEIAVVTEELNAQLPLGQKAMQKLFTYVELAWNSSAKLNAFGKSMYEKARSSQLRMKELLELANRQAEIPANKTALLAVGYTQAAITELKTISDNIDALNEQQEDMMAARGEKTEARITAYNGVWGFMKQINKASKVVYVDNPAKLDLYMLYPTTQSSLPKVQNLSAVFNPGVPPLGDLSWNPVVGASEYEVERSEMPLGQPVGTFLPLTITITATYSDPVLNGMSYYYRVRALNSSQSGAWSDTAQMDT